MRTTRQKILPKRHQRRRSAKPRANRRRGTTGKQKVVAAPAAPRSHARSKGSARFAGLGRRLARFGLRLGITGGIVYGLLLAAQGIYEYSTTSSRFEVKGLVFEPTVHVSDDRVRELLALESGTNILSLDLRELGERVVADPWVSKATVTRQLPDTLEVTIEEHDAAAVVLAGKFYLANDDGVLFKEAERGERAELPIITGIDRALLADDREHAEDLVRSGLEVVGAYETKQRPRLSEVHVGEAGDVSLYTAEAGTHLRLGRGHIHEKLARFDALRAAIGEKADELAVVHLDGRSTPSRPDRVVAKFFDPNTEAVLLAEARIEQAKQAEEELAKRAGGTAGLETKDRAPKKRRIPRAH